MVPIRKGGLAERLRRDEVLPLRTGVCGVSGVGSPPESGTGGKVRLLGISKRGDTYLRSLLIHGARVVVNFQIKNRNPWIDKLLSRRPHNVVVVAQANKMARTIWALLVKNTEYDAHHAAVKAAA